VQALLDANGGTHTAKVEHSGFGPNGAEFTVSAEEKPEKTP
jgi:hypothetical protein